MFHVGALTPAGVAAYGVDAPSDVRPSIRDQCVEVDSRTSGATTTLVGVVIVGIFMFGAYSRVERHDASMLRSATERRRCQCRFEAHQDVRVDGIETPTR